MSFGVITKPKMGERERGRERERERMKERGWVKREKRLGNCSVVLTA